MSVTSSVDGSSFWGTMQIVVRGEPVAMGYCHSDSCRRRSASPVNAFTVCKPDAVRITRGANQVGTYNKTPRSFRKSCKACGGPILAGRPQHGLIDLYAATIPGLAFTAGVRVNY